MYDYLRYYVVPPSFIGFFTSSVQIIALYGRGDKLNPSSALEGFVGNSQSWTIAIVYILWALVWLKLPGPITKGPPSPTGFIPTYKDNGLSYYFATLLTLVGLEYLTPLRPSSLLYDLMPQLLGSLNIVALSLCLYLYLSPSDDIKSDAGLPRFFIFYRGVNCHPRLFGVDVKQLTNCRIGMMGWAVLVTAFFITSVERQGFSTAIFTTFLLQAVYIGKFFYWEDGYFNTIDIMHDRAGYYLCWGCIVWIPCFFTYNSYLLVRYEPLMGPVAASTILAVGLWSIYVEYRIDAQKQAFRTNNGDINVWGKPAQYITAFYTDHHGNKKKSLLLTSGYWGIVRHLNYDFELVLTLCMCLPCLELGLSPFSYFIFLFVLVIHRVFRDEDKCRRKYGVFWEQYCEIVPYRMVPYVF